jgi:hypothetical protein
MPGPPACHQGRFPTGNAGPASLVPAYHNSSVSDEFVTEVIDGAIPNVRIDLPRPAAGQEREATKRDR